LKYFSLNLFPKKNRQKKAVFTQQVLGNFISLVSMELIRCLKPILLSFLFVPMLISCGSNEESDGKIVKIDVDSARKGKISDHFQSVEYILLDYPDSLPIVNLAKMIITEDRILVESRETAAVFVFDRKGNLHNVIRNYGEGPGQFVLIDDMFLEGDLVRIHNHYLKKYLVFNFDGSLIEEGKLEEIGDRSFVGKDFSLFQFQQKYDYKS